MESDLSNLRGLQDHLSTMHMQD